jgi:hypothetical protein
MDVCAKSGLQRTVLNQGRHAVPGGTKKAVVTLGEVWSRAVADMGTK